MISTQYVSRDPIPHAALFDRLRRGPVWGAGQERGWSDAPEALEVVLARGARSGDHLPALAPENRADRLPFPQGARMILALSAGVWGLIGLGAWHLFRYLLV